MQNKIKVGSDFSGVGAFNQALKRLNIDYDEVFACDMDKYARKTFIHNYGEPKYYPDNVYNREIPIDSLDIYMTSPPCQAFSLAGKRQGKKDSRGILFFNSLEFIQKNNPRYFIFENVKGLLSDDFGKTFNEWINYLGGKSVNGNPVIFPYEDSVPYHIYWKVLNAKNYNVPQNRERVFIVGIRDDEDNDFSWAKEEPLTKRLKDVLESEVDEKYFLSDKMVNQLVNNNIDTEHLNIENKDFSNTLRVGGGKSLTEKHSFDMIKIVGNTNPSGNGMNGNVFDANGISPTLSTNKGEGIKVGTWRTHKDGQGFRECEDGTCPTIPARAREDGSGQPVIKVKSATSKGYEEDTSCNQGVCIPVLTPDRVEKRQNGRRFKEDGEEMFTITTQDRHGIYNGYRIRRLTPRECFRLMDFPDDFDFSCVSDSQAYKQAGNSIVVKMLEIIIKRLFK
jgi:DNA (cytosine-5)-methyltransferase 1